MTALTAEKLHQLDQKLRLAKIADYAKGIYNNRHTSSEFEENRFIAIKDLSIDEVESFSSIDEIFNSYNHLDRHNFVEVIELDRNTLAPYCTCLRAGEIVIDPFYYF